MYKSARILAAVLALAVAQGAFAQVEFQTKAERKRAKLDARAEASLARLFSEEPKARSSYDTAYGYAVFTNIKIAFGISGGGGSGVAVAKGTNARTYMKMGTGGIGIGLGGQKYQLIFFFETKDVFDDFVLVGWQGDASAHAVAGTSGKNAEATFTKGLAIYQLSENGLMLHADVAGSKYWMDKRLNNRGQQSARAR